ncbi:MAG TPA: hypothetical protein VEJ20_01415 [Candidatus Eremiobacteraceae bacterium]|nr:hypothetical protein [Candidatus Eremiobacteraceae bacterium]
MNQQQIQLIVYVVLIAVIALRMLQVRAVRIGAGMWLIPALFLIVVILPLKHDGFTSVADIAAFAAAVGIGGGVGWWQSTHSELRADKKLGILFVKSSPWGVLIYVGAFIARAVVRLMAGDNTSGGPAGFWSTVALFFAVGIFFGMRAHWQREYAAAPDQPTPKQS